MIRFDHLAVGAADLGAGAAYLRAALGVDMPTGGRHAQMGTHNLLTATGPDTFLEVIAVDPDAPAPGRARWFGLDDPAVRAGLAQGPRPLAVVCATGDLEGAIDRARGAGVDYGAPLDVTRGDLAWRFAVRGDGAIPLSGAAPLLMEWGEGPHPAGRMSDLGLRYRAIRVTTPEARALARLLEALGAPGLVQVTEGAETALEATLATAQGPDVTLAPPAPAAAR